MMYVVALCQAHLVFVWKAGLENLSPWLAQLSAIHLTVKDYQLSSTGTE